MMGPLRIHNVQDGTGGRDGLVSWAGIEVLFGSGTLRTGNFAANPCVLRTGADRARMPLCPTFPCM
jgi:hypothetical protein